MHECGSGVVRGIQVGMSYSNREKDAREGAIR